MPSLTSVFDEDAPPQIKARGRRYFRQGAVEIANVGSQGVTAFVQGTSLYRVVMSCDESNGDLEFACSCPYFRTWEGFCKHIWATLLELESQGWKVAVQEGSREDVQERPKQRPAPPAPRWKEQLASIQRYGQAEAAFAQGSEERELLYVIDAAKTLATGLLSLEVKERRRKKGGDWGKPRPKTVPLKELERLPAADQQILSLLIGAEDDSQSSPFSPRYRSSMYTTSQSRYGLPEPMQRPLARMLCLSGRCWLRNNQGVETLIGWDGEGEWDFQLDVRRQDEEGSFSLSGWLSRPEERMPLSEPALLTAGGLLFRAQSASKLDFHGAFGWIVLLRREGQLTVPASEEAQLLEALLAMPALPPLNLPEELGYSEAQAVPLPCLKLGLPRMEHDPVSGELSFDYQGNSVAADSPGRGFFQVGTRTLLLRDPEAERVAQALLGEAGFREVQDYWPSKLGLEIPAAQLPRAVQMLNEAGWQIEAEGRLCRSADSFEIQVQSEIDWFEVRGGAHFNGQSVALPELLKALKNRQGFVRLDDGTLGLLPEEWLSQYALLNDLGASNQDHLRFARSQVVLLDALLASRPEASFDAVFQQAQQRLRSFDGIRATPQPEGFRGKLRAYQREGLGWMHFLQDFGFGGCLADDMGLGKTVQVLALLEARRLQAEAPSGKGAKGRQAGKRMPSLVVVPRSIAYNWQQEAARFTPRLRVLQHSGPQRSKDPADFADCDLVITTYGVLRRDAALLSGADFDYVILDEAQAIKNPNTVAAKAARLLPAKHRLALSGTPIENHMGELVSLFEFLNPGMLGSGSGLAARLKGDVSSDPQTRQMMAQALRPFILRRTKQQVASDLPPKTEQTLFCELGPAQRRLYNQLRDYYRQALLTKIDDQGLNRSKIMVLEALLRLRQAACHPGLLDSKKASSPSAKLDQLMSHLTQTVAEGHKALVFSQFTSLLALVRKRLEGEGISGYEYLDGRIRKRAPRVERFQSDPGCKLFLISLKAGGLGLNLTAAEYVFLLDPWWNPAVEAQAIDRAHRIGQTRQVFAYRLIARDTVEEKILELQQSKRELADAIITRDNSLIRNLRPEDLALLLS